MKIIGEPVTRNAGAGAARLVAALSVLGLVIVGALWLRSSPVPPGASPEPEAAFQVGTPTTAKRPVERGSAGFPLPGAPLGDNSTPAINPVTPLATVTPGLGLLPRGEPSAEARAAVAALTQFDFSGGAISPVQAAVWKESLRALVAQGESAVPAIREFLEKNLDLGFATLENGAAMGDPSLRMALLRAMQEIGGDQAIAGSLFTLQSSADPAELALVAGYLQKADPTQYREAVLAAAHEALGMAASGNWDGRDVAPLFDVLKTFGGEQAARDLEKYANTWFNYTPLVLAELPEGAGIDALIRLNADGAVSLGKEIYQRMLAQVSVQSVEAEAALLQLAKNGKIDPYNWRAVADALAGTRLQLAQSPVSGTTVSVANPKTYHVRLGNQNSMEIPPPADMPLEQVNQRIQIIDRLLNVTSDSQAIARLQVARSQLSARL